ncbi:MAG: M81 family metallopeptidase [Ectothiorhodospiraceae bacterium]|nr:M81 family metallopeptidase [Chromatiales bacterium]MCP5155982.1 M81 family metallopeptidase [Ectothiorhodospiraceae bacterium]
MRLLIAMMKHETNTFSPVPTDLARFGRGQPTPFYGDEAVRAFAGTGSGLAAFIDVAREAGAEMVVPIAAGAWPSGPVDDDAYAHICDRILEGVAAGCDAILLDLHGAMVTRSLPDGEGHLLQRVRAAAPGVPIGVALDMHTNLFPEMVDGITAIAGYQTYPHIDQYETALRAARPVMGLLRGELRPVMAWGNRPMLPHVMRQSSEDGPNRRLQARCRELESAGALACSVFTGFPHADVEHAGLSCVVVTDGDRELAERMRDELLDAAWDAREAFVYRPEPLADSMSRAARIEGGPVVLLDHYDNSASGGTQDTMTVLGAILDAGLEDVAAFAIHDPGAVARMIEAGVGARVTLPLGGKIDMPSIGLRGAPREVTGQVRLISDGRYRNLGPAARGVLMDMGPTVVLDTGKVEIVVISRHQEPNDLACFHSVGIDPTRKRYLMLKSRVHWRAGFGPVAKAVVECAGTGVCTSDYSSLRFERVRRPIYPLDLVNAPTSWTGASGD